MVLPIPLCDDPLMGLLRRGVVIRLAGVVFAAAGLSGCLAAAVFSSVTINSRALADFDRYPLDWGESQQFAPARPAVMDALRDALTVAELKIDREDSLGGASDSLVIYAQGGPFAMRQGEVARVVVSDEAGGETRVMIYTAKKMRTNQFEKTTDEYAFQIFTSMEQTLRVSALDDRYQALEDSSSGDSQ